MNLDMPEWEAPHLLSYAERADETGRDMEHEEVIQNESCSAVHAYHFLEHLDPGTCLSMFREIERVLVPGGVLYIAVPHAMSSLGYQALDHRTFWTEEGLQDLFYSAGYDAAFGHEWDMDITWMLVAAREFRNLCVLAQVAKRVDGKPYDTPWRRDK
jgi:SAM-dependent methyltransferase